MAIRVLPHMRYGSGSHGQDRAGHEYHTRAKLGGIKYQNIKNA